MTEVFDTVLIADRGEIACRIVRTLRAMGIRSVAVYSDADAGARHVRLADAAVRLGPAPAAKSYLDADAVISAARSTGAQAIHPGYGFLAENSAFARACGDAGLVFVGPGPQAIAAMGDKITAKLTVQQRRVPTVPGIARPGLTDAQLAAAAPRIGFPVLIKPSAGGGGKGMRVVESPAAMPSALAAARREAAASFGDDTLLLERYVSRPRHIEVQILADAHGNVIHLGERECSLQRRHQKVVEEAPSPLLDEAMRARIGAAACEAARSVDYRGAGTVEFIVAADRPDEFFFIEMNTRLQVEHPVTEEVTGVDLVEQQLRIAAGEALSLTQGDVRLSGHSIEARVYAEDPRAGFLPTGGHVDAVRHPRGEGIRVDTALEDDLEVSLDYDPMLAKIVATGHDREEARRRLVAALGKTAVFGFTTNVEFLRLLLEVPAVVAGELDTALIAREGERLRLADPSDRAFAEAALLRDHVAAEVAGRGMWSTRSAWRLGAAGVREHRLRVDGDEARRVRLRAVGAATEVTVARDDHRDPAAADVVEAAVLDHADGWARVRVGDVVRRFPVLVRDDGVDVCEGGAVFRIRETVADDRRSSVAGAAGPDLDSPMPGTVVLTPAHDGADVEIGDPVIVIEAMKMEHVVRAAVAGTVRLRAAVGDRVDRGQPLAEIIPPPEPGRGDAP